MDYWSYTRPTLVLHYLILDLVILHTLNTILPVPHLLLFYTVYTLPRSYTLSPSTVSTSSRPCRIYLSYRVDPFYWPLVLLLLLRSYSFLCSYDHLYHHGCVLLLLCWSSTSLSPLHYLPPIDRALSVYLIFTISLLLLYYLYISCTHTSLLSVYLYILSTL